MCQQVLVARVGLFRGGKAGKLAHSPKFAAIASSMDASGVRGLSGIAKILVVVPILRQISLGIKAPDRHAADGCKLRVAMLIEIDAGGPANGLLRRLLQRRRQGGFRPMLFGFGRVTSFKNFSNGVFRNSALLFV